MKNWLLNFGNATLNIACIALAALVLRWIFGGTLFEAWVFALTGYAAGLRKFGEEVSRQP